VPSRPPSAPFARDPDPINRALRRFTLFLWRIRFGWALTLVIGALLTAISVGLLATYSGLPRLVHQTITAMLILAWMCLGLLTGMFRRRLRGRTARWDQLTPAGRAKRALVTALGTVFLLAPFAWIVWLILR
jgi:hypothetical protein